MKNFWGIVNHVVKQADIILLVLDARFPEQTDNPELIEKAGEKDIIYVLNKADLVERKTLERLKKNTLSASTSPHSGHTKAKQLIKITDNVYLIDTPGVLPYMERDKIKLAMIGAEDFTKTKDPDLAAMELIKNKKKMICKFYGVKESPPEKVIESIAIKYKRLSKGGKANINETARIILRDWQKGKITLLH